MTCKHSSNVRCIKYFFENLLLSIKSYWDFGENSLQTYVTKELRLFHLVKEIQEFFVVEILMKDDRFLLQEHVKKLLSVPLQQSPIKQFGGYLSYKEHQVAL